MFERNTVVDSGDSGVLIVGSASIGATFERNTIERPSGYGIRLVQTVQGEFVFERNTVRSSALAPFSNASAAGVVSDQDNDPDAADGGDGEDYVAAAAAPVVDGVARKTVKDLATGKHRIKVVYKGSSSTTWAKAVDRVTVR